MLSKIVSFFIMALLPGWLIASWLYNHPVKRGPSEKKESRDSKSENSTISEDDMSSP